MNNLLKLLQPPTYKSKIKLYCPFIIADFPQKVKKETEKRNKVINICEIKN